MEKSIINSVNIDALRPVCALSNTMVLYMVETWSIGKSPDLHNSVLYTKAPIDLLLLVSYIYTNWEKNGLLSI